MRGTMARHALLLALALLPCAILPPRCAAVAEPSGAAALVDEAGPPEAVACPAAQHGHRRANDAAETMRRDGELALAFACYGHALEVRPGFAPALYGRGLVSLAMRRFASARAFLQQAVAAWPEYSDAWTALGEAYATGGGSNRETAAASFKKVRRKGLVSLSRSVTGWSRRALSRLLVKLGAAPAAARDRPAGRPRPSGPWARLLQGVETPPPGR